MPYLIPIKKLAQNFKFLGLMVALLGSGAFAQNYPERPIKLVIPWPAGGITDLAGRIMAQRLAERMGTPVVVENRAGAAATIGAEFVARAPADSYTLLLASAETHAIAPTCVRVCHTTLRKTLPP